VSRPGLFDRLAASAAGDRGVGAAGQRERRCCCGRGSVRRVWGTARRGCRWGPASAIRSGFWLSVLGALRRTSAGSGLVRAVTAAPDLDGWAITERLLKDLAPLADRTWLVLDDVHELGSDEARRQLELLVMARPGPAAVRAGDPA